MNALRSLAAAFGFLTRLPLPAGRTGGEDLACSPSFFPLVGYALGGLLAAAALLLEPRLSPALTGVALVALLAAVTGGLHLDGVADVFDALGGARGDRERALAIMRDSRIGAHGAAALFLVLIAKAICLAEVVAASDLGGQRLSGRALLPLVAFPAVARWTVVASMTLFPYVRQEGLGTAFRDEHKGRQLAWATVLVVPILVAGRSLAVASVAALAAGLALGLWMRRRIGGLTGDVYGATIEIAEVAFLLALGAR